MERVVEELVAESVTVKTRFFAENRAQIVAVTEKMIAALRSGRKVLLFGNGGSAADAQHIATELVGRFGPDRPPMAAIALTTDTSLLTSVSNDYGYSAVFSRQVTALGQPGDVAIGISTSGNSPNVLEALDTAKTMQLITVGFTGETGGKMNGRVDFLFRVPSRSTPRIQETHITLGHVICDLVDRTLFPEAWSGK